MSSDLSNYEYEHGEPIPGRILPPSEWAKTAVKRLPAPGPRDWGAMCGRVAPVVLDLGCGNGRFTLASALARPDHDHFSIDVLPVVIRYATRRANQRGFKQRPVRRERRYRRSCGHTSAKAPSRRSTSIIHNPTTTRGKPTCG